MSISRISKTWNLNNSFIYDNNMKNLPLKVDIVIFGGGIAGLWIFNRLRNAGYQAILLESHALGSGQTIKSQGIIHGGLKYALTGFLNASANAVEDMPKRWKDCLAGTGEIDLRSVNVLSHEQLLWSTGSLGSEIAGFFASKSLNSRVKKLDKRLYPSVLQNPSFKGHVYRLEEVVLDTVSLIDTLAKPHQDFIFKINPHEGYAFTIDPECKDKISSVEIRSGQETLSLQAERYLFTAGEGNEQLSLCLAHPPVMQRRPLQMLVAKFKTHYPFFGHCIDTGMNPRITITTHPTQDDQSVWYLGGQIAEDGVNRSPEKQIAIAKKELNSLLPWLEMETVEWRSFFINRAEPAQPGGKRPDSVSLTAIENVLVAWPTKLALSPLLADQVIAKLKQQAVQASSPSENVLRSCSILEKPRIALAVWDELFQ